MFLNNTEADCLPKEATDSIAPYFDSSSINLMSDSFHSSVGKEIPY